MGCAADNVVAVSDGKANVVILTDSQYAIADRKAKTMQRIVQSCKTCSVLDYVDSPMAESSTRMPQLVVSLKQRFGPSWTGFWQSEAEYRVRRRAGKHFRSRQRLS